MLDWCPVCENEIPPERYTIQLPPAPIPAAPDAPAPKPPTQPAKTTSGQARGGTRRPPVNRQNSRNAVAKRTATKTGQDQNNQTKDVKPDEANEADDSTPAGAPATTRHRTVISQGPTPLYCSEKCRLEDEAASNALSQMNMWTWANPQQGVPPSAGGLYTNGIVGRAPLPIPVEYDRSLLGGRDASISTTTTSTGSVSSIPGTNAPAPAAPAARRPGFLQMTSMPDAQSQANGSTEVAFSAPATTDIASHPPTALPTDGGPIHPRGVHLDRFRVPTQPDVADVLRRDPNRQSTLDLYTAVYPLAFAPNRSITYSSKTNSARGSRNPSRKPTPILWDDVTPTQSLLIPRRSKGRKDDSLELRVGSHRSDSGSSTRSKSSTSQKHRARSRDRHAQSPDAPPSRPPLSRSRSSRSGASSVQSPSSYKSGGFEPGSLGNSRQHFQARRQSHHHPLSSSFSAKDAEAELRTVIGQRHVVSQSVPNDGAPARWSWWGSGPPGPVGSLPETGPITTVKENKHDVKSTDPPSVSNTTSPASNSKTPLPISTSSSTATIAALPARRARLSPTSTPHSPSSALYMSSSKSGLHPPKQNSSIAGLAGMAASILGFGGIGGLTMTAAHPSSPPKPIDSNHTSRQASPSSRQPAVHPAVQQMAQAEAREPERGRSRASSRASQTRQLLASLPSSLTAPQPTTVTTKGAQLPLSMSTMDLPRAKRPLGPLPKELEEKSRSASRLALESLTIDVNAKRKDKRPASVVTHDSSPSVDREESKSPSSEAPRSAWDPELVRGLKESRRLSRETSYFGVHPSMGSIALTHVNEGPVNPFHISPPMSPSSPSSPGGAGSRSPYSQRRRTTSAYSKSHSRSQSHSTHTLLEETDGALPRVKSNQSIASMNSSSSHNHGPRHNRKSTSREPPSPSATAYSIAGPPSARALPRGLSMTSLSQQTFGMMQGNTSMYGNNAPVQGGRPGASQGLSRTASQPYVSRWFSTSPTAGGSAFGSPTGNSTGLHLYGMPPVTAGLYAQGGPHTVAEVPTLPPLPRPKDTKPPGPTYPILQLPTGTRKKKVKQKVQRPDGTEEEVLVDGSEEEEVYEKPKRLFYFDR